MNWSRIITVFIVVLGLQVPLVVFAQGNLNAIIRKLDSKISSSEENKKNVAEKYLNDLNLQPRLLKLFQSLTSPILQETRAKNPTLGSENWQKFSEIFIAEMATSAGPLIKKWYLVRFIDDYTVDEINAISSFRLSPVGESFFEKISALLERVPANLSLVRDQIGSDPNALKTAIAMIEAERRKFKADDFQFYLEIVRGLALSEMNELPDFLRPILTDIIALELIEVVDDSEKKTLSALLNNPIHVSVMRKAKSLNTKLDELGSLIELEIVPTALAAAQAKLKSLGKDIKI